MLNEIAARGKLPAEIQIGNRMQSGEKSVTEGQGNQTDAKPIRAALGLRMHDF